MMAVGIPEYRLPKKVLQAEIDRIAGLGVELRLNSVLGRDFTLDALRSQGFSAILLATGASKSQRIGIPGEDAEGVWPATYFLKQVNLGEKVELTGVVLVVGGGSTAMDAARTALRVGARTVRVLYRRTREDMPAQHEEVRAAEHEGIEIVPLITPLEVVRKNGWMTGVRCGRLAVGGRDADGRNTVTPVPNSEFVIEASALMVAVGEAPDPSILPKGSSIQVADWGGVVVDSERLATAQPGVFAAGDVATGPRSVIEGVAQGQRAAWAIDRHLRGLPAAAYIPPWQVARATVRTRDVEIDLADTTRATVPLRPDGHSRGEFAEVAQRFDDEIARSEAQRCLRCDVVTACSAAHVIRRRSA
jgi:NADH-quinone oxidoreductase subunit F